MAESAPAYPLKTGRLRIEPLGAAHRDAFVAYRRDPQVAKYQGWDAAGYDADAADSLIAKQPATVLPPEDGWLQLALLAGNALVGDVAIHTLPEPDSYELGVTLAPSHQGQGYAAEAIRALAQWLFASHAAHRVMAQCDARNTAVKRLFAAAGFRHEGSNVESEFFKGEWVTVDTYAVLGTEWKAPPA